MWRNGNVVFFGWSSLGFDSRVVWFWIFEPHSKNHSKGAKIPQINSKYSEFRMCISLGFVHTLLKHPIQLIVLEPSPVDRYQTCWNRTARNAAA